MTALDRPPPERQWARAQRSVDPPARIPRRAGSRAALRPRREAVLRQSADAVRWDREARNESGRDDRSARPEVRRVHQGGGAGGGLGAPDPCRTRRSARRHRPHARRPHRHGPDRRDTDRDSGHTLDQRAIQRAQPPCGRPDRHAALARDPQGASRIRTRCGCYLPRRRNSTGHRSHRAVPRALPVAAREHARGGRHRDRRMGGGRGPAAVCSDHCDAQSPDPRRHHGIGRGADPACDRDRHGLLALCPRRHATAAQHRHPHLVARVRRAERHVRAPTSRDQPPPGSGADHAGTNPADDHRRRLGGVTARCPPVGIARSVVGGGDGVQSGERHVGGRRPTRSRWAGRCQSRRQMG